MEGVLLRDVLRRVLVVVADREEDLWLHLSRREELACSKTLGKYHGAQVYIPKCLSSRQFIYNLFLVSTCWQLTVEEGRACLRLITFDVPHSVDHGCRRRRTDQGMRGTSVLNL